MIQNIATKHSILLQLLFLSLLACFEKVQPTSGDYQYSGDDSSATSCGFNRSLSNSSAIMITSPGWPNEYTHNEICEWTISTSSGYRLEMTFNSFSTENSYDTFSGYENGHRVFRHSGTDTPSRWTSSGNIIVLRFISDGTFARNGFQLFVRRTSTTTTTTQSPTPPNGKCSSLTPYLRVTSAIGTLQSPNFPLFYPENSFCIWNLTAPVGMSVLLNFSIFETESCCDTFEIFENGIVQLRLRGVHSGKQYISSSNSVELKFRSDNSISELGFYIYYAITNETTTKTAQSTEPILITAPTPTTTKPTTAISTTVSTTTIQPTTTGSNTVQTTTTTTSTTTTILSISILTTTTKATTERTRTTRTPKVAKTTPAATQTTTREQSTNGETLSTSAKARTTQKSTTEPPTTSILTNITSISLITKSERITSGNTVGDGGSPTTPSSAVTWLSRSLLCVFLLLVSLLFCKEF